MRLPKQIAGLGFKIEHLRPVLSRASFHSLLCLLKMHRSDTRGIWNGGFFFSTCGHCRKQLIRRRCSPWEEIPKGFKVVWKARKGGSIDWTPWRPEGRLSEPVPVPAGAPVSLTISRPSDELPIWQEDLRAAWRRASQRR